MGAPYAQWSGALNRFHAGRCSIKPRDFERRLPPLLAVGALMILSLAAWALVWLAGFAVASL